MELACTSPWKTVISIYKNLHTSGFLFGALCLFESTFTMVFAASPPPRCLWTRHTWAKRGSGNLVLPQNASLGSCLPPSSGLAADPSTSVWTGLAGTSAFGPMGLFLPHQKGILYAPGISWFLDLKTWNFETDKTPLFDMQTFLPLPFTQHTDKRRFG